MTPEPKTDEVEALINAFYEKFPLGCDTWVLERHQNEVVEWLRTQAEKTKRQRDIDVREAYAQGWNEGQQALTPKPPNGES